MYIISVLTPKRPLIWLRKVFFCYNKDDIFIIGGLVDRSVIKYASLNRAEELKI